MVKNIVNVRGIKCWGAHTGIKSLRRDLAIIYSVVPASVAAVFTQNSVIAEPIKVSRDHIANGRAQAIVCNAGNANACTGEQGYQGAVRMAEVMGEELEIDSDLVVVASTGLIGEPFPTEDILQGIRDNVPKLSDDSTAGSFAANAILTTDTFAKEGFVEFEINGKTVNMAGIAKGSGMIHPNMATMLSFIVTDAAVEPKLLQEVTAEIVDKTFNMITVDGDTSTNDMVTVLANGLAANDTIDSRDHPDFALLYQNLEQLMLHLSELIVSDGEGASKFIRYSVQGAKDTETARKLARAMSASVLVKTAMFGRDANWGRLIAACGNAGVGFDYTGADLYIGDRETIRQVLEKGKPTDLDRSQMKKLLRESHLQVKLVLHDGDGEALAMGTDMTTDYVLFNSVYTT